MLLKVEYFQKKNKEKDIQVFSDRVASGRVACAAKISDRNGSDQKQLEILCPKQMNQQLPIAPTQVKAGNTSENVLNKSEKIYILCIEQNKLLKGYT